MVGGEPQSNLPAAAADRRRIAIVGHCASGKSTLSRLLRERGWDARAVAQEHSGIKRLWMRMDAHVLVALHVDLATLRARRTGSWSGSIYNLQETRLQPAIEAADLVIDTAGTSIEESIEIIERFLHDDHCAASRGGRTA